ncbi:phosphonate C-P lyase system protein PhnH [Falsigemmobacter faecalis]|uniref:Phosphonate C-P lyase system protein PhnH n=1 Tax=Falsigemmobacter faecalis TaxID=2488730 RepID=A0A3P3DQT1_9RHOB|nr:phosphonate C-P lyase system protein PhnH [Falsigemmobacter faecalis]RRH76627.1 phosphonate C-P lyase system protein PhnH [Falsigemmobacter faecalis]
MTRLTGGFIDPATEAATGFRAVLEAMARPGRIFDVTGAAPPAPLSVAAGVVLLTLCDHETPLFLAGRYDCAEVRAWIAFHCGAPFAAPEAAAFALGDWQDLQPVSRFRAGEPAYPDRSATLLVERSALAAQGHRLSGPGIRDHALLNLPETAAFQVNHARFPLGFDVIFTAGAQLAALPRSTRTEAL